MKLFKASVEDQLWHLYLALDKYFKKDDWHNSDYLSVACYLLSAALAFWCKDVESLVKEIKDGTFRIK